MKEKNAREAAKKKWKLAYNLEHRDELREKKKAWYRKNHEYALLYQKAYSHGVRLGTKGPPKKAK